MQITGRSLLTTLCLMFIVGCSGTGQKNNSVSHDEIKNREPSSGMFYFKRLDQLLLSDQIVAVKINGQSFGNLGSGEHLAGQSQDGANLIEVRFSGVLAPVMIKDEPVKTVVQKTNQDRYFLIKAVIQPVVAKMTLNEVSKDDWLKAE